MTNRWWRALAVCLLLVLLLGAAVAVLLAQADPHVLADAVIRIDGDRVAVANPGAHPLAALVAGVVVASVALVVVPVVVCIPLLVVALALGVALLAIVGSAALVLSPILLTIWIAWRLARPTRTVT